MISCLLVAVLSAAAPTITESTTEHYHVRSAGMPAEELGRMLEQHHAHLKEFLGREPNVERLDVELYADQAAYKQAAQNDLGGVTGESGGIFFPGPKSNHKVYLFVQPSDYWTRHLMLHETTHQFHFLAQGLAREPNCPWYVEGLAECFGMHTWDGKTLQSGVVPAITLEDYPAQAEKLFQKFGSDLQAVISGRQPASRPLGWAIVHLLANRYPRQFAAMRKKLDSFGDPWAAWQSTMGPMTPKFTQELHQWILQHQQPWQIVWTAWQDRGGAIIEGASGVNSMAVLKDTTDELTARLELIDGNLRAGLVFGYKSPDDFSLLQVLPGNTARIIRQANKHWQDEHFFPIPPAGDDGQNTLTLRRSGSSLTALVNGKEISRVPADGQLGLNSDACKVYFHWTTVR